MKDQDGMLKKPQTHVSKATSEKEVSQSKECDEIMDALINVK